MIRFLKKYFSSERRIAKFEQKLNKAIQVNDQQGIIALFCEEFIFLLQERNIKQLSDLILIYGPKIKDAAVLGREIPSEQRSTEIRIGNLAAYLG